MDPKSEELEKPGKNVGMTAIIVFKHKTYTLVEKKCKWKVASTTIFNKFRLHCGANMKIKLSDVQS